MLEVSEIFVLNCKIINHDTKGDVTSLVAEEAGSVSLNIVVCV